MVRILSCDLEIPVDDDGASVTSVTDCTVTLVVSDSKMDSPGSKSPLNGSANNNNNNETFISHNHHSCQQEDDTPDAPSSKTIVITTDESSTETNCCSSSTQHQEQQQHNLDTFRLSSCDSHRNSIEMDTPLSSDLSQDDDDCVTISPECTKEIISETTTTTDKEFIVIEKVKSSNQDKSTVNQNGLNTNQVITTTNSNESIEKCNGESGETTTSNIQIKEKQPTEFQEAAVIENNKIENELEPTNCINPLNGTIITTTTETTITNLNTRKTPLIVLENVDEKVSTVLLEVDIKDNDSCLSGKEKTELIIVNAKPSVIVRLPEGAEKDDDEEKVVEKPIITNENVKANIQETISIGEGTKNDSGDRKEEETLESTDVIGPKGDCPSAIAIKEVVQKIQTASTASTSTITTTKTTATPSTFTTSSTASSSYNANFHSHHNRHHYHNLSHHPHFNLQHPALHRHHNPIHGPPHLLPPFPHQISAPHHPLLANYHQRQHLQIPSHSQSHHHLHHHPPPPFGINGQQQHVPPHSLPFPYFNDLKFDPTAPWNQFLPPLPPHSQSGLHHHMVHPPTPSSSGLSPTPLPAAFVPIPLDFNCPPSVLPQTNSSSGYSTATGHSSRSPSPMMTMDIPMPMNMPPGGGHNTNVIFAAPANELALFPILPTVSGQHIVYFHINPGVSVSFHVDNQVKVIQVSTSSNPPMPLPMQVPQGHVVQQIVDENGTLRHVIVSHQPPLMPIPAYGPGNQSQPFFPPGHYPTHFPVQPGVPCPMPSNQGPSNQPNAMGPGFTPGLLQSHPQPKDERTQRQLQKLQRKFQQKHQREGASSFTPQTTHYHQNGGIRKTEGSTYTSSSSPTNRRPVANGQSKSGTTNGGCAEEEGSVGSTGSVTSTQGDEDEETRMIAQTEMLSALIPPTVSEVTSVSAFIQWSHPERINESGETKFTESDASDSDYMHPTQWHHPNRISESGVRKVDPADFRYEVSISDKSRENRFRSIFIGSALSCRVKDLRPGSTYAITYCAILGETKGNHSAATTFSTLPDIPDAPPGPRAMSRSRSSIQFKWNAPNDNGAKITNYILEYDEGKGGSHFVEVYKGKNKQSTVSKLQPAYSYYQFRLAAVNQCDQSRYSSVITVMTAGSPPLQPSAPTLTEAGVTYLTLQWKSRATDDEYTLQMEDPVTGHGYICMYNGSAPHYTCIGLKRRSQYKFRVKAQNEEGHSRWSEEVILETLPGRPSPPHKPQLKGRIHAYSFKVTWVRPADDGGVPITCYALEIDQGNGGFEIIYRGTEMEYNVDKLSPGQSYALRVIAIGPGGESDPSEASVITTEPVCPGKCNPPRVIGKPKSNSVHIKWLPPQDGGSPINLYEVDCTVANGSPTANRVETYRGKETDCFVNRLLPGRAYLLQIRAFNRIGGGPWSNPLEIISGAGAPSTPLLPKVVTKTSHIVIVSWTEPQTNGSAISEYRVQMATPAPPTLESDDSDLVIRQQDILEPEIDEVEGEEKENVDGVIEAKAIIVTPPSPPPVVSPPPPTFNQVFVGSSLSCEVKGLQPATVYLFRVQANNSAGSSDWSAVITHQMPASSPSNVSNVEGTTSSDSISVKWSTPNSNGSPILHYNVLVDDTVLVSTSNAYTIENLNPDTQYKIRVQGVNSIGPGGFSPIVKLTTKPLAPSPPRLECTNVAHFWMKLKWSEVTNKNIEYLVQMIDPYHDEFQVVYRGHLPNCKVTRLTEDTEYQFRICALNSAGQGPFSDMYRFCTQKAPPSQVKGLKMENLKEQKLYKFEWAEVNNCNDIIDYQLQVGKRRDQEFQIIYRGTDKKAEIAHEELSEGVEYSAMIRAIRVCDDGTQLTGPYSSQINFHVPQARDDSSNSKSHSNLNKSLSTAQARNTFFQMIEEKMQTISYESRIGILAVFALFLLAFVISMITHHVVS